MGGRREVSIISYRPVTRSDLKQERSFFCGCLSTFFATGCLSPSYPCSRGARLLNGVKRGALLAPKEVVIKNSISFLSVCLFKNGETKTAVVGPFVYVVICKKLGF